MVDYFMAYNLSKFDGWALLGAWAGIGTNTIHIFLLWKIQYTHNTIPLLVQKNLMLKSVMLGTSIISYKLSVNFLLR